MRPVLTLMRESAELAGRERSVVWQQLHSAEAELRAARSEREADTQRLSREKAALQQKLTDSEATVARLKVLGAASLLVCLMLKDELHAPENEVAHPSDASASWGP